MQKRTKKKTQAELYSSIRKDWGGFNPVSRVVKDKSKYTRKNKHKGESYGDC